MTGVTMAVSQDYEMSLIVFNCQSYCFFRTLRNQFAFLSYQCNCVLEGRRIFLFQSRCSSLQC